MIIEHIAFQHPDPVAAANWYEREFRMKTVRRADGSVKARFLADANGQTVLEIYNNSAAPMPDYPNLSPVNLHLAFLSTDLSADTQRLIAGGATLVEQPSVAANGDQFAMLRDPWGIPLQLVKRAIPLLTK